MPDISTRLELPYIQQSQAQKHVTHNEALRRLDALVQTGVARFDAASAPSDAADGVIYGIGASPSGEWAGQAGHLAMRDDGSWIFLDPQPGWHAWDLENGRFMVFESGAWRPAMSDLSHVEGLGIGTGWDGLNRLSVQSEASLFSHDGGDHRLKINKAGSGDSASLVFQSNWTGHAEIGLAGNDAFAIKVSPDGSSWTEALRFDGSGDAVSGSAVQQNPTDTSTGRLMRADWGYGPGNILGTVSQSGGTPTGAVIERGSNANGDYVRFADGMQICWGTLDLGYNYGSRMRGTWTYPASFASVPTVPAPGMTSAYSGTPGPNEIGLLQSIAQASDTIVDLYRSAGGTTNFDPADTYTVRAMAVGRWF